MTPKGYREAKMLTVDEKEAPKGYRAVESSWCDGCEIPIGKNGDCLLPDNQDCVPRGRKDGCNVTFKKITPKQPHVWVVEMKGDKGKWKPCDGAVTSKNKAEESKVWYIDNNPFGHLQFRVAKYVREDK